MTKELAEALDGVWTTGVDNVSDFTDDEDIQDDGIESEIRSILIALILYSLSILPCSGIEPVTFVLSHLRPGKMQAYILHYGRLWHRMRSISKEKVTRTRR